MDKKESEVLISAPKSNRIIIKHASAIHCSNSLSLLQRKISNVLLFHAYPSISDGAEHKISIRELSDYLGYKSHDYQLLKDSLKVLISTVIEWNLVDDKTGQEDWTASSILASVNIKNSICTYAYSPRMRALFASPTMYGKINLAIQSQFTSSYGLALYENCVRYRGLNQTKEIPIEVFRKIMGVPDNTYKIFRDFKRRILDKAVEEVNTFSDLFILAELKRAGRKVVSVRFIMKERKARKKLSVPPHINNENCKTDASSELLTEKLIQTYKIKPSILKEIIGKYGLSKINQQVLNVESSAQYINGNIKNLGGYLVDALKNDYVFNNTSMAVKRHEKDESEKAKLKQELSNRKQQQVKKTYDEYVKSTIGKLFNELSADKQSSIIDQFKKSLQAEENHVVLEKVRKRGLDSDMVRIFFKNFILSDYPEFVSNIKSYELFTETHS